MSKYFVIYGSGETRTARSFHAHELLKAVKFHKERPGSKIKRRVGYRTEDFVVGDELEKLVKDLDSAIDTDK